MAAKYVPAAFTYKELVEADAIRILLLQPQAVSLHDEIHCSLQHITLSEFNDDITLCYHALSYVWGSEEDKKQIVVDGIDFYVTVNLFNALVSLRHQTTVVPLWVDAICIDQQNLQERGKQVQFMGSIYASAQNTVIYLGETDEHSDWVIQSLKVAGTTSQPSEGQWDKSALRERLTSSILSRPWFSRVWVLQELALSRSPIIQCGVSRVKWAKIPSFIYSIEQKLSDQYYPSELKSLLLPEAEQRMMDMQQAREQIQLGNINKKFYFEAHGALMSLLRSRSGLGVKDPRDIVFAHLGMISHVNDDQIDFIARNANLTNQRAGKEASDGDVTLIVSKLGLDDGDDDSIFSRSVDSAEWDGFWGKSEQIITVDYKKPVSEVYNEIALIEIENSRSLSFTTQIQETHPQDRITGLSSWAPDVSPGLSAQKPHLCSISFHLPTCSASFISLRIYNFIQRVDANLHCLFSGAFVRSDKSNPSKTNESWEYITRSLYSSREVLSLG